jgi:aconitate hydratase
LSHVPGGKVVIARSFERIHAANLINFGILPLTFKDESEYENIGEGDRLEIEGIRTILAENGNITVKNLSRKRSFEASYDLSERQTAMLLAGGALNMRQRG